MAEIPADVMSVVQGVAGGGRDSFTYLDPGQPGQRAAIEHFLERCGKTAERYPALHGSLASGDVEAPGGQADSYNLVSAGRTPEGKASAGAWVGARGGAFISGAHTVLLDAESGGELASGSRTQVGGGLVQNFTEPGAAATPRMTAVSFFHAQRSPEEPVRFGLAAAPISLPEDGSMTINVQAPVEKAGHTLGYVTIGLCRDSDNQNPDCDYVYPSAVNVDPDRLVVPCVGNVEFNDTVNGKPSFAKTQLWFQGETRELRNPSQLMAGFEDPVGNTIGWSFPADEKPISETASLQFEPLTNQVDDNIAAFLFQFHVSVGDARISETVTICSTSWPPPHTPHCKQIDGIKYWWHCVDGAASVTLADGTKKPLVEIDNQTQLRLPGGQMANVVATTLDDHDEDSDDPLIKLETEGGITLLLSAIHPVLSNGMPVKAQDLNIQDPIDVESGTDRVRSCEHYPHSGPLCNLLLEGAPTPRAFYANGIAVGDFETLTAHAEATRYDADYMLARLPESHHADFCSALADATAR